MESSRNFTENSNFKCEIGEKSFSTIHTKKLHIKTVHEGAKKYSRNICNRTFGRTDHLTSHLKSCLKGPKNFKCETCEKILYTFRRTEKSHTDSS